MVGSSIVRRFQKEGYNNLLLKTRQEVDLINQKAVEDFFEKEKPEYVILSAARVGGIKANMTYPADFLYENTQIQNNIIWAAHNHNVKKLLFLGSACIYPRVCPQPMKEEYFMTGPLEPTNEGYSIAKIAGMKLCDMIYEQFGQCFISCMPNNIYGSHDHFNSVASHVLPALVSRIHAAKKENIAEVVIWGSGKSRREFLYVDDLADAVYWMMHNYEKKEFVNVGTGTDISIKELAFMIKDLVGYEGKLVFDTTKPDGMPQRLADVSKLNELGWKSKTPFEKGLKDTYQWFLDNYEKNEK